MKILKHIFFIYFLHSVYKYQYVRNVDYYGQKSLHHLCHIPVYSNRLVNYNFECELSSFVNTLNDVLSDIEHEGSLDANDLTVHKFSFIILLYFDGKF